MAAFFQAMMQILEDEPAAPPPPRVKSSRVLLSAAPAAPPAAAEPRDMAAAPAPMSLFALPQVESIGPIRIEKGRYFEFIRIDVRHEYYGEDGPCRDLRILPTAATQERLTTFGIIARPRPDGIDLLWETTFFAQMSVVIALGQAHYLQIGKTESDFAARVGPLFDPPLLFTVELLDPDFLRVTELPQPDHSDREPRPLHFSTRALASIAGDTASFDVAHADALDRPASPSAAGWIHPSVRPDALWESGEPVQPPADDKAAGKAKAAPPAKADQSDGPAQRERNAVKAHWRGFGLLDLHLVAEKPSETGGWDGMPVNLTAAPDAPEPRFFHPCTYRLDFRSRRTRWRYLVAARQGELDGQSLAIVGEDGGDAGFALDPEPVPLPHGGAARSLASANPLPLRARADRVLTLMGRPLAGSARPRVLRKPLPSPGPGNLSAGPAGGSAPVRAGEPPPLWSDIYVFL